MKKSVNKIILSMAIASILGVGLTVSSPVVYAGSDKSESGSKKEEKKADSGSKKEEKKADSGSSNRGNGEKKIIICHIPKGNPANRQTIHIAFDAWPAHRDNHGGDWLGSCNNPPNTKVVEDTVVIKDCQGTYRKTLLEVTQSYFDPVIVNDDALDDEDTVVALSQCLDKGDSSDSSKNDSGKNKPDSGKGGGRDSVSDSGKHHRISGCNDKDSSDSHHKPSDSKESDSSKNYRKKLEQRNKAHNQAKGHGDSSLNISDSSLDDSGVYKEYKKCVDSDSKHKGDSGKGDSGHKYRIMNNCSNATAIKDEIKKHHEQVKTETKYEQLPIIIKTSSLTDKLIKSAVDECLDPKKGGGKKYTVLSPAHPTSGGPAGFSGRINWKELSH